MKESLVTFAVGIVLGVACTLTQWPDMPAPASELIVDDFTGCHYIVGPTGGVTPRMTAPRDGESMGWHICSGAPGGDDAAWVAGGAE